MTNLLDQIQKLLCINTFCGWLMVLVSALLVAFCIKFILSLISNKLHKFATQTRTPWDNVLIELVDGLKFIVLFFWLFFLFSKYLTTNEFVSKTLMIVFVALTTVQIGLWGLHLLKNWYTFVLHKKIEQDPSSTGTLNLAYRFIQAGFIVLLVLIALSNLKIDIGALLTGLGIGGIAVALAAQSVLGDLLASISIVLDKPFRVGDLIMTGTEKGVVRQIGIKTTRLRSVSGEEVIISNKNILDSRIYNYYQKIPKRRVVQRFSIVYSTSVEILEKIPDLVKNIMIVEKSVEFERCHLVNYGASGLDFEFSFFVLDQDSTAFMALQNKILLEIFKKFNSENVQFAYPTQKLYVEKLV